MAFRGLLVCFLGIAVVPAVVADAGALRPYHRAYASRHPPAAQHRSAPPQLVTHPAAPVEVAPVAPVPQLLTEPVVETGPMKNPVVAVPPPLPSVEVPPQQSQTESTSTGDEHSSTAVKKLRGDLAEMKQVHGNVAILEKTLAADVTLLRESATLQRVSTSARGRKAAKEQVRQAEKMVRDTEAMVRQSRHFAMDRAREALDEASAARKAADALSAEASAQLKLLEPRHSDSNIADSNLAALQVAGKITVPKAAPQAAPRKHVIRLTQIDNTDDTDTDDSDDDDDKDDA